MKKSECGRLYIQGKSLNEMEIANLKQFYDNSNISLKISKRIAITAERSGYDIKTVKKYLKNDKPQRQGRKKGNGRSTKSQVVSFISDCFKHVSTLQNKEVKTLIDTHLNVSISESMVSKIKTDLLDITYKKASLLSRQRLEPRVINMRNSFKMTIRKIPITRIISLDECNIEMADVSRKYGHSARGERAISHSQRVVKLRYSLIMFVTWNGILYYELIDTTHKAVDSQRFLDCMKRMNTIKPPHMICQLDNASIHNELSDIKVIWQPPYSPDFNPIEKVFGLIKSRLKGFEYSTFTLENVIKMVISSITADDVRPFFLHCSRLWHDDSYE
jgi:hypothetical protein